MLVYENDSKDSTLVILRRWEQRNKRVRVISEHNVSSLPWGRKRTHILSHARNLLLAEAMVLSPGMPEFCSLIASIRNASSDYFIVMDMDERIDRLSSVDILSSFAYTGWAVMTANQYNKVGYTEISLANLPAYLCPIKYYDIWALRTYGTPTINSIGAAAINSIVPSFLPPFHHATAVDDWSPDDWWECAQARNMDVHYCLKRREVGRICNRS